MAELEQRVERMRACSQLRRRLRDIDAPAEIAAAAVKFAHDVLGVALTVYVGDKDAPAFELLSGVGVESALTRDADLVVQLERGASMIPGGIAVALRAAPAEMFLDGKSLTDDGTFVGVRRDL